MQRRNLLAVTCAAFFTTASFAVQAAPVAEVKPFEEQGLKVSNAKIREAIKKAAQMRGWGIVSDEPGKALLVYPTNNRSLKYQATVAVTYGKGAYKVSYVKSRGLDERRNGCYGKEGVVCVHRNVNRWMANLGKDLKRLLSQD